MRQSSFFFSMLMLSGGLLLVFRSFFPSLPSVTPIPAGDIVISGALERLSIEEAPDWQLKNWQEEAWATFREDGLSWTAPEWFTELMGESDNKREAMKNASLRLYPESRRK